MPLKWVLNPVSNIKSFDSADKCVFMLVHFGPFNYILCCFPLTPWNSTLGLPWHNTSYFKAVRLLPSILFPRHLCVLVNLKAQSLASCSFVYLFSKSNFMHSQHIHLPCLWSSLKPHFQLRSLLWVPHVNIQKLLKAGTQHCILLFLGTELGHIFQPSKWIISGQWKVGESDITELAHNTFQEQCSMFFLFLDGRNLNHQITAQRRTASQSRILVLVLCVWEIKTYVNYYTAQLSVVQTTLASLSMQISPT